MKYNLPSHPGCYLMKDSAGSVIYVGKAKDLHKRVGSYFTKKHDSKKTTELVSRICDVDYIVTDNEVEALLLENTLIKKHMPQYNIMLKDSKSYAYLVLTDEKFPRLLSTREVSKFPRAQIFGPYTDGSARWRLMRFAQRLFKVRTCRSMPRKVCLMYHIERCSGPCEGHVCEEEYALQVQSCAMFLKGENKELIRSLRTKMISYSALLQFEKAKECRDIIETLESVDIEQKVDLLRKYNEDFIALVRLDGRVYVGMFIVQKGTITTKKIFDFEDEEDVLYSFIRRYYSDNPIPKFIYVSENFSDMDVACDYLSHLAEHKITITRPIRGDKRKLVALVAKNVSLSLEHTTEELRALEHGLSLSSTPHVIDCFDMSNFSDKIQVGACVRFVDGKSFKEAYRRFRIKSFIGQDDVAAMHECVKRRYYKHDSSGLELPDLIVIDGGKGQLGAASRALSELKLSIPVVALAKQEEEVFMVGESDSVKLARNHKGLNLLRRIRDEAHRFVIAYIRLLRDKEMLK